MANTSAVLTKLQELQRMLESVGQGRQDLRQMATSDAQKAMVLAWELETLRTLGIGFEDSESLLVLEKLPPTPTEEKGVNTL